MTDYRKIRLRNMGDVGFVSHGNASAFRPMRRTAPLQVLLGQDRLAASSRRIIAQGGLQGANDWMVSEVNSDTGGGPTLVNPSPATTYTVWPEQRVRVNPGCILALRVSYWPSGYTQNLPNDQPVAPALGIIAAQATWHSAVSGTSVDATVIECEPATGAFSPPPSDYPAWGALRTRVVYMAPDKWAVDPAETHRYSQVGTDVTLVVVYQGSPRIAYWCVYEVPHEIVTDLGDAVGPWAAMVGGDGMPSKSYLSDYPIETASADDPYYGATAVLATMAAEYDELRGGMVRWTAGREHDLETDEVVSIGAGTGDNAYPPLEVTATSLTVVGSSGTAWAADEPGLGVSHMAYLAAYDATQHALHRTRSMRCIVSVRWKVTGGTGALRVQTAPHSYAEATTTSTTYVTTQVEARLDVGPGAARMVHAVILASVTSTQTLSLAWVSIEPVAG